MLTFDHLDAIDCLLKSPVDPKIKIIMYQDLIKPRVVQMDPSYSDNADEE